MAKVNDLLAWGLLGLSIWVLFFIIGIRNQLLDITGVVGSAIIILVEGYFLIKYFTRTK